MVVAKKGKQPSEQEKAAALEKVAKLYEEALDDKMGLLHNRFVAFIAEARLPLPQVVLVLEILLSETIEQAKVKYGV